MPAQQQRGADGATAIQQSIARIHEACQAPPLSPPEYRALFDVIAQEINANQLSGTQTLVNISERAQQLGLEIRREDIRFVLDVVSEADPWFEQGASANLFASRFRNFVVARCRGQGMNLSSDELDLIEAWFSGGPGSQRSQAPAYARTPAQPAAPQSQPTRAEPAKSPPQTTAPAPSSNSEARSDRWWSLEEGRQHVADGRTETRANDRPGNADMQDEFPRIVRTRQRG